MINKLISSTAYEAAKIALDGLSMRRDVIAQNMANVDTPNYKAQEVDFETTLQRALYSKKGDTASTTMDRLSKLEDSNTILFKFGSKAGGTERADGNNVDSDQELTSLTETGLRYDAIARAVNMKLNLMKTISTGR